MTVKGTVLVAEDDSRTATLIVLSKLDPPAAEPVPKEIRGGIPR